MLLSVINTQCGQSVNSKNQKVNSSDSLNSSDKNQKYICDPLLIAEAALGVDYISEFIRKLT